MANKAILEHEARASQRGSEGGKGHREAPLAEGEQCDALTYAQAHPTPKVLSLTLCTPASQVCHGPEDTPWSLSSHIHAAPCWLLQQGCLAGQASLAPGRIQRLVLLLWKEETVPSLGCHSSQGVREERGQAGLNQTRRADGE